MQWKDWEGMLVTDTSFVWQFHLELKHSLSLLLHSWINLQWISAMKQVFSLTRGCTSSIGDVCSLRSRQCKEARELETCMDGCHQVGKSWWCCLWRCKCCLVDILICCLHLDDDVLCWWAVTLVLSGRLMHSAACKLMLCPHVMQGKPPLGTWQWWAL